MRGSMRARTAAASVLVVGAGVLAAGLGVAALVHNTLLEDTDRAAVHGAQDVAALIQAGALPERLPIPSRDHDQVLVQVTGPGGGIVSVSDGMVGAPLMLAGWPPPAGQHRSETVRGLTIEPAASFRVVALTTPGPAGSYTVYAATELGLVARSDAAVRRLLLLGGPPFLALVALVSWLIADRALRRVEGIRMRVDEIIPEALGRRVPEPPGDDEITRLTRTMNEMLERLQAAEERQRRFVADASHELKSPLAAVQADLEVALAHPDQADWPATAARLLAEDERMERLVADLLFLAQCDEGDFSSLTTPAEAVRLDQVVGEEAARLGGRWSVPVDIDVAVPDGRAPIVAGRPEHLGRAVRNLLENAARHARRGVSVELRMDKGEIELVVVDDGPGIDPAQHSRVFDRFTRLDDARGRDEGGTGLGLPIAREIVEAHGGRISIGDGPGGRVVVRLPLGGFGGQSQDKPSPRGGGLDRDVASVGQGDVAHDGQREAGA